jgi:hypothetical protein
MRRRVWTIIIQHELLTAVKIGLPKQTRFSESDTLVPRNLYEEELYEDMKELPNSRPLTEDCPSSYFATKFNIMVAYGCVVEFLHVVKQSDTDIMTLDNMLLKVSESVPPHLQVRPLEDMQNDPPWRIMER